MRLAGIEPAECSRQNAGGASAELTPYKDGREFPGSQVYRARPLLRLLRPSTAIVKRSTAQEQVDTERRASISRAAPCPGAA
jgi:hypothetical protein